jgi:hypothetical protein
MEVLSDLRRILDGVGAYFDTLPLVEDYYQKPLHSRSKDDVPLGLAVVTVDRANAPQIGRTVLDEVRKPGAMELRAAVRGNATFTALRPMLGSWLHICLFLALGYHLGWWDLECPEKAVAVSDRYLAQDEKIRLILKQPDLFRDA